jgi:hypothetical protein
VRHPGPFPSLAETHVVFRFASNICFFNVFAKNQMLFFLVSLLDFENSEVGHISCFVFGNQKSSFRVCPKTIIVSRLSAPRVAHVCQTSNVVFRCCPV